VDFEVLAARTNIEAWDAIGAYTESSTMSIPQVHDALQEALGNYFQRDLTFWNSIIDQLYGSDDHARYMALREEWVQEAVSTS
jgi:hypothetical protein